MIIKAFLLSIMVAMCVAEECGTPLFRDVIAPDASKTRFTLDNIGDSGFVTGLPLINSTHPLVIRIREFTTAILILAERDRFSPHYWVTAVDLQQGAAGVNCASSGVVEEMSFEFKEANGYRALDTPFREGIDASNSNPTLNLKKLGGHSGGRVVRLRFQPAGADGIRIKVLSIDPLTSSITTEACLRVELYGCEKTTNTPPAIYTSPLYQYNLVEPSADSHTDPSYTGIRSGGYLSGGEGILTDDVIGMNAVEYPREWVGWQREQTREIEVLFLFRIAQQINRINIYFWEDGTAGIGTAEFRDQDNNTINFDKTNMSIITNHLKLLSCYRDTETVVSYVKLMVSYATDRNAVIITEIQIVREKDGYSSNVITGRNVLELNYTQSTVSNHNTTKSQIITNTTTTEIATIPMNNTTMFMTTNRTSMTTNRTTNRTTTSIFNTSDSTSINTTVTSSHTAPSPSPTQLSNANTILVTSISSCLALSLCTNAVLLVLLGWCCWRCLSRRGSLIVQGREYQPTDEGTYLPMSSLQLHSYHNILETDDKQQQTPDTPDNHYYSRLDDLKEKDSPGDFRKYYQFRN